MTGQGGRCVWNLGSFDVDDGKLDGMVLGDSRNLGRYGDNASPPVRSIASMLLNRCGKVGNGLSLLAFLSNYGYKVLI